MRWVKVTLAIGSTLLCGAVLIAWAVSYLPPHPHFVAHHGALLIARTDLNDETLQSFGGGISGAIVYLAQSGNVYEHFLGFAYIQGSFNGTYDIYAIPFWFLLLLTGIGPALWWFGVYRGRRRRLAGHCARCGYDLRATPGRCPECGFDGPAATDVGDRKKSETALQQAG